MSIGSGNSSSNPAPPEADLSESSADALRIGGWEPFTTVDFPGRLAAVVFLQGCPWRCAYCHNTHLRGRRGAQEVPWSEIRAALERRAGFLEGVAFSGGEPTGQVALLGALQEVRSLGLATGLHTAGIFPQRLKRVLPWVDWVGLDVKAPPDSRYDRVTGRPGSAARFLESLELVRAAGVEYQLRTTVDPALLSPSDCDDLQAALAGLGVNPTTWQTLRASDGKEVQPEAGQVRV